jgi:carboxyl-terminal processing protease
VSATRLLGATLAVGVALAAGMWCGIAVVQGARAEGRDPYIGLETLAEALHTIEQRHVEAMPTEKLLQGAVSGMADQLDRHSVYLTPERRAAFQDRAEGGDTGVGATLGIRDGRVLLEAVTPAGPADLAGAKPGDTVLAVDDVEVSRVAAAEQALRGPRDTPVRLRLQRGDQTLDIQAVRDTVLDRSVRADRLTGDIAHVQIDAFRRRSGTELRDHLARLEAERPLRGVVLDLRGNPGGLLEEAVVVVDTFVSEGTILEVRGRGGRVLESHAAHATGDDRSLPLVVLIDGGSASAAEIVAGALQDLNRAALVGSPSYGKGSVQKLFLFEDGGGLKLTIARYHLPSGRTIPDGEGLVPDQLVDAPRQPTDETAAFRSSLAEAGLSDAERAALLAEFDALPEASEATSPPGMALPPAERMSADPVLAAAHARLQAR